MNLGQLLNILEDLSPTRLAEPWDNVGLLVGDPDQSVSKATLAIDLTPAVLAETIAFGSELVIVYHPPIFKPIKSLRSGNPVFHALRNGLAIYSPHTALDVAEGGTNDMLADALWLSDRRPLRIPSPASKQCKLVTFVPVEHVEQVSQAMFNAGAGVIGDYTCCSFRSEGLGTFFGQEGTNPTVGQAGRLETAREVRIETVVPLSKLTDVVAAMRSAHPYEEPAFDLVQLLAAPEGVGMGRIGEFAEPFERTALFGRIKRELNLDHLLIAGPRDGLVKRVAVCAGSCGDLLEEAIRQKAELFLTGEVRHHDALRAAAAGMTVVCTLHSNSERAVLNRLAVKLAERAPQVQFIVSREDRDPFMIV